MFPSNIFLLSVCFRLSVAVFDVVGLAMCGFESLPFTGLCIIRAFYIKKVSGMFDFLLSVGRRIRVVISLLAVL